MANFKRARAGRDLAIDSRMEKIKLFCSLFAGIAFGACSVLTIQTHLNPKAPITEGVAEVEALAEVGKIVEQGEATEELAATTAPPSALAPFWEDAVPIENPLGLHFPVYIEPEKPPQITTATTDQILSDFQGRIGTDFQIPDLIFNQTKFWFRIYTEYDSNKKIIHDALHPHIVFDIVDITDTLALPTRAQWLNVEKAQKLVAKRVQEIKMQLRSMANKSKDQMNEQELAWLSQFEGIEGNTKKIILSSIQSIRVQTGQKNFFENGLTISGKYLPEMEEIFEERGLPTELTRLPFVESSFVIGATSKVGAAGIWQFMPGIGKKFMMVNDSIDERRNPFKATEAAAKLLKENHMILHRNWGLALTAYNHGPGGVRKAIKATGSKDIAKIVRSYRTKNFDFASSNFFTCFLAALHAHEYRDLLFKDHNYEPKVATTSLRLKKAYRAHALAKATDLTREQILALNPELDRVFRRNEVIPKGYRLFFTLESMASVEHLASR